MGKEEKACKYCFNSSVCDELTSQDDLSYIPVGHTHTEYSMFIRTGANRPTAVLIMRLGTAHGKNENIAVYEMKYCPECGRRLTEND